MAPWSKISMLLGYMLSFHLVFYSVDSINSIDTSALSVSHCGQATAFVVLNRKTRGTRRKAHGTRRDGKTASKSDQQDSVNSAGTSLTMAEKKKKREGLVIAVLTSAARVNDAPRSIKELPFSCFPIVNEAWKTGKPRSEHVVDPMIRS